MMRKLLSLIAPEEISSGSLVIAKWYGAAVLSLWAGTPVAIQALMILMSLDWLSGAVNALLAGTWTWRTGVRGLWSKVFTLIVVVAAYRFVQPMHLPIDFVSTITLAFDFNELTSVVENLANAGAPIPPVLLDVLVRARKLTGRGKSAQQVRDELEGEDEQPKAKGAGQ